MHGLKLNAITLKLPILTIHFVTIIQSMTPLLSGPHSLLSTNHVTVFHCGNPPGAVRSRKTGTGFPNGVGLIGTICRMWQSLWRALLPAARGTMVPHQTDSSEDNVTPSVQSRCSRAGISRRALPPARLLSALVSADRSQRRWALRWLQSVFVSGLWQQWL